MLSQKIKICVGYNGKSHSAFIYKNIEGKKYCKICSILLESMRGKKKSNKINFQSDKKFYLSVWQHKFFTFNPQSGEYIKINQPRCEACGKNLPNTPNLMFFHHILEKKNYPELRHSYFNIAILCSDCHSSYEAFPYAVPWIMEKRKELIKLTTKTEQNEQRTKTRT